MDTNLVYTACPIMKNTIRIPVLLTLISFMSGCLYAQVLQTNNVTPYDFLSIMHYARNGLSKNGNNTILPKPEYWSFVDKIDQRAGLSYYDKDAMRMYYTWFPQVPLIVSPANNESNVLRYNLLLSWNRAPGDLGYDYQIAAAPSFHELIMENTVKKSDSESLGTLVYTTM